MICNSSRRLKVNGVFIQDLYRRFVEDRNAVDQSWRSYFEGIDVESGIVGKARMGASHGIDHHRTLLMLGRLIENYRWRGHLRAKLDPLGIVAPIGDLDLELDSLGLSLGDESACPDLGGELGMVESSLPKILTRLEEIYCGSIGFEFMHVQNAQSREWLRDAIESGLGRPNLNAQRVAAKRLIDAEELEHFMQRRFPGKKRFGAEGAESLMAWLGATLDTAAMFGVKTLVMGGTSRARLNQMANVVGKPLGALFAEFYGAPPFAADYAVSGDVAYHLGYVTNQDFDGRQLRIDYCYNPSHLEAIDPVALGRTRALQAAFADAEYGKRSVWSVLVHTDSAFSGQGVVAETFQLSGLKHYSVGGTIHVVVNNQVGFTTNPESGRTSHYCTDFAKTVGAPIFHVNADDVDAVIRTASLAAEYRMRFQSDVVVDLVCYRRRGHNEADEPSFTQPKMYAAIAAHSSTRTLYTNFLTASGKFTDEEEREHVASYREKLEAGYSESKTWRPTVVREKTLSVWAGATGIELSSLRDLGIALCTVPAGITLHSRVEKALDERRVSLRTGEGIEWALAESLAFGSLMRQGIGLRLSGQDTPRGAFSHRHYLLHDTSGDAVVSIFEALKNEHAVQCEIINSPLAEYSTLGFEYGYSLEAERQLVLWEAQFGDFLNVAQAIVDQFISSGEDKWMQRSHLVLLLPHGMEGQGSEHSSGRIERMLQLCASGNICVANCSSPGNYFHLLRRQGLQRRCPLVIFTPKSLLRNRDSASGISEFDELQSFQTVIGAGNGQYKRLIICSGKIYWALEMERRARGRDDVGLIRIEQLHPFPSEELARALQPHVGAEVVWCQEEPFNMGAWTYVDRLIERVLSEIGFKAEWPRYKGRPANPSPSNGTFDDHIKEQKEIISSALG